MKSTKLKNLADGYTFKRSLRSKVTYQVVRKEKGIVIYTSLSSNLSFSGDKNMVVYVKK
jgi:hypothetical protein